MRIFTHKTTFTVTDTHFCDLGFFLDRYCTSKDLVFHIYRWFNTILITFSTSKGKCSFDLGLCDWANDLVGSDTSPWTLSSYRGRKKSAVARPDHGKNLGMKMNENSF